MRVFLILIFELFLCICAAGINGNRTNMNADSISQDKEPIIGERIDGPANIRDTINGEIIFKLYDNVLVVCTPPKNGWHIIAIEPTNPPSDYSKNFIKKGTKILVGNLVVGEAIQNAEVTFGLRGYTQEANIKPETIIENALTPLLQKLDTTRSLLNFQKFINNFQLRKDDQFKDYTVYYNGENWIEDASPMHRIGLVFQNNRLVAILHSRPLKIINTIDYRLDRAFNCLVYNDIKKPDKIVQMFNNFVNSVD